MLVCVCVCVCLCVCVCVCVNLCVYVCVCVAEGTVRKDIMLSQETQSSWHQTWF